MSEKKITSLEKAIKKAENDCVQWEQQNTNILLNNHQKVMAAFQDQKIGQECFSGTTGYGYGDHGRDRLDQLFAQIFCGEDALVRHHFVSGTHALSTALFGILRPGDHLISFTGIPYDTLLEVIGVKGNGIGSLFEHQVRYDEMDSTLDFKQRAELLPNDTRMIMLQRSRGYSWKPSLSIAQLEKMIYAIRKKVPNAVVLVDNCYGEFVEDKEPLEAGADLIAGSLIKNPGGGLAPTGGYIVGKRELIEAISYRLTSPGIGRHVGSTHGDMNRLFFQGIYLAPHTVGEALKGAVFASSLLKQLGYVVSPDPSSKRSDVVQAIQFNTSDELIAFCQAIQSYSPVDAYVKPLPWDMPGYADPVIMAAGTFVSGATSELSADAPIREPYTAYLQGGLSYHYTKLAVVNAAKHLLDLDT